MKKFECTICNYETYDKSNFRKHKKTTRHLKLSINDNLDNSNDNSEVPPKYNCKCGRKFMYASGLSRHKKNCYGINIDDKVNMLDKINMLEAQLKDYNKFKAEFNYMKKQLYEAKTTTKQVNNTINISVKNYIQQNYSDAPQLLKLNDYTMLKHQDEDDEYDFANILKYHYINKDLHSYLGDFIIKQYKKEDPSKQSIWNSDVSRLTYIIKELLANKKTCWNHDPKGTKTKNYIITPLLNYVHDYCVNYMNDFDIETDENYNNSILNILGNIIKLIGDGELANDIVKYIAPYFKLDKDDGKIEYDNCFVDSE